MGGLPSLLKTRLDSIIVSITGFGAWGKNKSLPSFDLIAQALGGGMSLTGEDGGVPLKCGLPIGDLVGGLYGAISVLAGLASVQRGKTPVALDVSLLDAQVALLSFLAGYHMTTGQELQAMSSKHLSNYPWGTYETRDGHVVVAAAHDHFWRALCTAFSRDDLGSDERYQTNAQRVAHRDHLEPHLQNMFRTKTSEEAVSLLQAAGVPVAKVRSVGEVLRDENLLERAMVVDIPHPNGGHYRSVGSPIACAQPNPAGKQQLNAPPSLGADTREVLASVIGSSQAQIDQWAADEIISAH